MLDPVASLTEATLRAGALGEAGLALCLCISWGEAGVDVALSRRSLAGAPCHFRTYQEEAQSLFSQSSHKLTLHWPVGMPSWGWDFPLILCFLPDSPLLPQGARSIAAAQGLLPSISTLPSQLFSPLLPPTSQPPSRCVLSWGPHSPFSIPIRHRPFAHEFLQAPHRGVPPSVTHWICPLSLFTP